MNNESNVLDMGEFLVRRFHLVADECLRLNDMAESLSNQKKDVFAKEIRTKADAMKEKAEGIRNHIRFIAYGGNTTGLHLNPQGYSMHTGIPPVVVSMNVDMDPPKKD